MPSVDDQPIRPTRSRATPVRAVLTLEPGPGGTGLYHGDCLEVLPSVAPGSVQLAFADPPYNIGVDYDSCDDNLTTSDYLAWCVRWLDQLAAALAPEGSLWLLVPDLHVAAFEILAERRFALTELKRSGELTETRHMRSGPRLYLRHHVIWYYTFGQNSPKKLTPSHANLLHFVRSPSNAVWYPESVRIPSAREEVYNDRRAKPGGRLPDDTWIIRPTDPRAGFEDDHSVWHVPRICGTFHQKADTPNQIPEQILGRIIRFCTKPGDLVLDCFSGSGTTPATAKKLGRRYLGIEQSPVYFEQGKIRVDGVNVGDPLDGSNLPEPPRTRNSSPCPTPVVPSPIPTTPELPPIRPPRRRASGSTP